MVGSEDDSSEDKTSPDFCISPSVGVAINNASFTWDPEAKQPTVKDVDVNVPKGKLTMIVGPVGSGKSSLVSRILLHVICVLVTRVVQFVDTCHIVS